MKALDRIEAILTEIERLDKELQGQGRQYEDREALDTAARIERKLKRDYKSKL